MSSVALEQGVLPNRDLNKQIPGRPTGRSCFTLTAQADTVAGIDTGGHLNRERFGLLYQTLTATLDAGV